MAVSTIFASMQHITSRRNPLVSRFRDAAAGDAGDALLLDGAHLVEEAIASGLTIRHALVASGAADRIEMRSLMAALAGRGVETASASDSVMDAVSPVRSASVIVALADRPAVDVERVFPSPNPLVVITEDVQDPGNLGAIVRVAEAGGASGLVAAGSGTNPFGWKALRGSMGSALRLPIAVERDVAVAVGEARRLGCRIVATVPHDGQPYSEVDLCGATALLIGGEGAGLFPAVVAGADVRVSIPMCPPVESLNAAVAAALLVYEARRQRASRDR
jgi:TrmH family RNA methyltransferase